jgi:hypothetical protein
VATRFDGPGVAEGTLGDADADGDAESEGTPEPDGRAESVGDALVDGARLDVSDGLGPGLPDPSDADGRTGESIGAGEASAVGAPVGSVPKGLPLVYVRRPATTNDTPSAAMRAGRMRERM